MKSTFRRYWPVAFVILHFAKWAYLFHRIDFSSEFPIVNFDYVQYYARVLRMLEIFRHSGRFWGYDPFEMAGYPAVFREVGTYFLAVIAYGLSGLIPVNTTVLLTEMGGHIFVPFLIVPTVRNLGGNKEDSWIAFAVVSLMYGSLEIFSAAVVSKGIFGFMMASFVALWQTSLFWKWSNQQDWGTWGLFVLASSVLLQLHAAAAVISFVPNIVIYVFQFRSLRFRNQFMLLVAIGLIIGSNWYWLHPFIMYADWMQTVHYFESQMAWMWKFWRPVQASWLLSVTTLVHGLLFWLTLKTLVGKFQRSRHEFFFLSLWLLSIGIIVCAGNSIFVELLLPYRYVFPFSLLVYVFSSLSFRKYVWNRTQSRIFAVAIYITALSAAGRNLLDPPSGSFPFFSNRLPLQQATFIKYLRTHPDPLGRTMLECGYRPELPNIADIVSVLTRQVLIGGHDPGNFLLGRFTLFGGLNGNLNKETPVAFGKPLVNFKNEDRLFCSYVDLYNITRVVAWSEQTIRILNNFPYLLKLMERVGQYNVYQVNNKSSWFYKGSGRLSIDYDALTIDDISDGDVILKFHWIGSLRAAPPLPVSPIYLKDDPVPFISINNNCRAKKVLLYNAGL